MNFEKLQQLNQTKLNDYVWRRLRLEAPLDPPLSSRFGDEPPEQFLVEAVNNDHTGLLRQRVFNAIQDNLSKLSLQAVGSDYEQFWVENKQTDQHIASLAYMISILEATELIPALSQFAYPWIIRWRKKSSQLTDAQFHVLRTLAHLQEGKALTGMWQDLWENGPQTLRGLIFFGWVRASSDEALQRLGDLADSGDNIDLPATLWSLIGPIGIKKLALQATKCSNNQRRILRKALIDAGADQQTLAKFDPKDKWVSYKQNLLQKMTILCTGYCARVKAHTKPFTPTTLTDLSKKRKALGNINKYKSQTREDIGKIDEVSAFTKQYYGARFRKRKHEDTHLVVPEKYL